MSLFDFWEGGVLHFVYKKHPTGILSKSHLYVKDSFLFQVSRKFKLKILKINHHFKMELVALKWEVYSLHQKYSTEF